MKSEMLEDENAPEGACRVPPKLFVTEGLRSEGDAPEPRGRDFGIGAGTGEAEARRIIATAFGVRGYPLPVDVSTVSHAFNAIAVACLTASGPSKMPPDDPRKNEMERKKAARLREKTTELLFRAGHASDLLIKDKSRKALIGSSYGDIGTHAGKIPVATVPFGSALADPEIVKSVGEFRPSWVSGLATDTRTILSAAGNAGYLKAQRLLRAHLSFGGAAVTVAEILKDAAHPLQSPILAGLTPEAAHVLADAGALLRQWFLDRFPAGSHSELRTLLMPTDRGRYVSVTPLLSNGLSVELHARLAERRQAGQRISTRDFHVGGGRPTLAGVLSTDLFGTFQHLTCNPPSSRVDQFGAAFAALRKGREILRNHGIGKADLAPLAALLSPETPNNKAVRDGIETSLRILIGKVVGPLHVLADHGEPLPASEIPSPSMVYARLLGLVKPAEPEADPPDEFPSLDRDEIAALAERVVGIVTESMPQVEVPGFGRLNADDGLVAILRRISIEILEDLAR